MAHVQHVYMFVLYTRLATLLPTITCFQLASKFPSSSIMDQGMFSLLAVDHLSKQALNSPPCPGTCPSDRNGDLHDTHGEQRQRRAAQILISEAVFELVSLSQSVARGNLWRVKKRLHNKGKEKKTHRLVCIPLADAAASITVQVLRERERARASPLY